MAGSEDLGDGIVAVDDVRATAEILGGPGFHMQIHSALRHRGTASYPATNVLQVLVGLAPAAAKVGTRAERTPAAGTGPGFVAGIGVELVNGPVGAEPAPVPGAVAGSAVVAGLRRKEPYSW